MSCRRAQTVDLAGFLEDPQGRDFDVFRAHYPRCAECSSEVRVWTELHLQLLGETGHPTAQQLLAHEEERLPSGAAVALSRHLADCVACRDEVAALRSFGTAPVAVDQPTARLSARWSGLGRVLWHPAFAYALVGLLLFPALWMSVGGGREAAFRAPETRPLEARVARADPESEALLPDGAARPAAPPAAPADALVRSEALARSEGLVRSEAVPAAEPTRVAEQEVHASEIVERNREGTWRPGAGEGRQALAQERLAAPPSAAPMTRLAAKSIAVADARDDGVAKADAMAGSAVVAQEDAMAGNAVVAQEETAALAGAFARDLDVADPQMLHDARTEPGFGTALRASKARRPSTVGFAAGRANRSVLDLALEGDTLVAASDAAAVESLVVPLAPNPSERTVSVRVADASDRRVLREERRIEPGSSSLELALPAGWLRVGRYSVEVRPLDDSTGEPLRFSLEVKEP